MVLIRAARWLVNSTPSVGTKTTKFCEALELSQKISTRRGVTRWNSPRVYDFSEAGNSASGSTSNIRIIPIQANIRNAASWPFQIFDCHIKNHSPPTDKKATNHCKRLRVRPMIAGFLACWKLDEADFRLRRPLKVPHQQRTAEAVSHPMIVA